VKRETTDVRNFYEDCIFGPNPEFETAVATCTADKVIATQRR